VLGNIKREGPVEGVSCWSHELLQGMVKTEVDALLDISEMSTDMTICNIYD
jgi:hypothetical protein